MKNVFKLLFLENELRVRVPVPTERSDHVTPPLPTTPREACTFTLYVEHVVSEKTGEACIGIRVLRLPPSSSADEVGSSRGSAHSKLSQHVLQRLGRGAVASAEKRVRTKGFSARASDATNFSMPTCANPAALTPSGTS